MKTKHKTPMDAVMDQVDWEDLGVSDDNSNVRYATHSGVLDLFGAKLKCYRLNTGEAVFDSKDLEDFFGGDVIALAKEAGVKFDPIDFVKPLMLTD